MSLNKYGLSRNIPEDIKREIRQACGFGCVCCGLAIGVYEHIDPEFHEAKEHDPEKMAYLCQGCHDRVTRKFWSKEKIKQAKQNPWCIQHGKCRDAFDIGTSEVLIWLGGNKIEKFSNIIYIEDNPILIIENPEDKDGPFQLTGNFYDYFGNLLFHINKNEWFGESGNWDIECVGGRITIRTEPRKRNLQIACIPGKGIVIEKIDMVYKGTQVIGNQYQLKIKTKGNVEFLTIGKKYIAQEEEATLYNILDTGIIQLQPFITLDEPIPSLPFRTIKISRNAPCICGSGLKYKKCCLKK